MVVYAVYQGSRRVDGYSTEEAAQRKVAELEGLGGVVIWVEMHPRP